jgi:hypothetical protein
MDLAGGISLGKRLNNLDTSLGLLKRHKTDNELTSDTTESRDIDFSHYTKMML